MSTALAVAGLVACVVALVTLGLKMAQKGGRKRGRLESENKALQDSAEARARFDAAMAKPLDKPAGTMWADVLKRRRLREEREGR